MSEGRCFARAALAGNPSDRYRGAVLAVCVRDFCARATVRDAAALEVAGPGGDLARAACRRIAPDAKVRVEVSTDVPREVGLAGSSAIVIATLRAVLAHQGRSLDPTALARTALAVEVDDLGIPAGLQDRVCQAYEGLVAMDFARHEFRRLDAARLPPLYVAWLPEAATPSAFTHRSLRERFERGEPAVRDAMARLREYGSEAASAVERGDHASLAACIDGSYDARATMLDIDPRLAVLVHEARAQGCSANYAGSGGAIVGTITARDVLPVLDAAVIKVHAGSSS